MCLTLGNNLCSEAFSFDSVRKEYSQAEDNDYQNYNFDDFDYKERITTSRDKKDDYIELNLNNIEIFTSINNAKNSENRDMTKEGLDMTPHDYKNFHQKQELEVSSEKDDTEDEVKPIFKEKKRDQESKDVSPIFKRDKIMLILARVVELCLIMLVIVCTILCVILLCAIKFCWETLNKYQLDMQRFINILDL